MTQSGGLKWRGWLGRGELAQSGGLKWRGWLGRAELTQSGGLKWRGWLGRAELGCKYNLWGDLRLVNIISSGWHEFLWPSDAHYVVILVIAVSSASFPNCV